MESRIEEGKCFITPEVKQIDMNNATAFGDELSGLLDGDCDFIINLENINFMDSSGLGKIIEAIRIVRDRGKRLVFCNIRDAVKVLFSMVNLSQIAVLCDTLDDAVAEISR